MAIKFVLVEIVLVETVLVGDPLYIISNSVERTENEHFFLKKHAAIQDLLPSEKKEKKYTGLKMYIYRNSQIISLKFILHARKKS